MAKSVDYYYGKCDYHTYGKDNRCIRCGTRKPIKQRMPARKGWTLKI